MSLRGFLSRLAPCAAVAIIGCGPQDGTAVGNGRNALLDISGYEDPMGSTQSIDLADGTQVETIFLVIDRVRLVPVGACENEEEENKVDLEGPVVADLAGGGVLGGAPGLTLATDRFCELRVGYHKLDLDEAPAGTPPELEGLSMRLAGTRADGASFVVESQRDDRFELESEEGFALPLGTQRLFLAYEIGGWIDALALGTLGPGPIVIDNDQNPDRLDAFETAVAASARLFRDADGDGALGFDERSAALAE